MSRSLATGPSRRPFPAYRALVVFTTLCALAAPAAAGEQSDAELFRSAVSALETSALDDAIDRFELLADRGVVDASASYDRGVAYARRGGGPGAHAGDLGRAAAGFEEALRLQPDDPEASRALERVTHEIARRRARIRARELDLRPALSRIVIGVLPETTWFVLSLVASTLVTVGLGLRLFTRAPRARLTGVVVASVSALTLLASGTAAALARRERLETRPAVVIVEEARLTDERGSAISGPGSILPEGASVLVLEQSGSRARVEWGTLEGWLSLGQLRLLSSQ